jgi:glycosyltransferase involved in cell wall biosynthesis
MLVRKNILIIGPTPNKKNIGGVHNHIKNLIELNVLKDSIVYDPGSLHSNIKSSIYHIMMNIIKLNNYLKINEFDVVLINASLYLSSVIKMIFLFGVLRRESNIKLHIFFHGGRVEKIKLLRFRVIRNILRVFFINSAYYHFLCNDQYHGFNLYFKGLNTSLYSNYSNHNNIVQNESKDNSHLVLIYVGRMAKNKGIYQILDAFREIYINRTRNIYLKYVGNGPELERLRKKAMEYKLNNVNFTGYLSGVELENEYKNAHIFVFPTYHDEGFPYTLIESFRAGLPMIATPVGALNDYIIDGRTGYLIDRNDSKSLVKAIEIFLSDYRLYRKMSKNCHRIFQTKLSRSQAEKYYGKLISN